jgi:hypothetical protein
MTRIYKGFKRPEKKKRFQIRCPVTATSNTGCISQEGDTMDKRQAIQSIFEARQERSLHPDGEFDSKSRWFPSDEERCDCCNYIRFPSAAFPYSYMVHCRTKKHIQKLVEKYWGNTTYLINLGAREVPPPEPRRATRKCSDGVAYKKVAIGNDGRLHSVFNGSPWLLGIERKETAKSGHQGGLYVYASETEALEAPFPDNSWGINYPKAVVKCLVKGSYRVYTGDKLAFSSVTPINIIKTMEV